MLDKRPERARETLEATERTSSRALQEMRAILGVLRDDNDGRVPHPGLDQLDELTGKAREAGLDVELEAPSPPPVTSAVGNAVYRILQESITNVLRHAGPTRVTIALDYGADAVARAARPEVVLMDIRMPKLDGIQATRQIATTNGLQHVRVLILTTYDTDAYVLAGRRP